MITLDSIILPADMKWEDEFTWSQVRQSVKPSLTGAQLVQMNTLQAGRPITLVGESEGQKSYALIYRSVVEQLRQKEIDSMGLPMTLTFSDARTFQVIFRYDNAVSVEATPWKHRDPPLPNDYYFIRIRLMTVTP